MVNEQEKTSDKIINNNICNFFCKCGDWAIINEVSCNGCSTNVYINYVAMSTVVRNFIKKVKFPYILLRLMLIIIIGLNFISDIELLIGNRIIAIVFILVVVFLVYKKWLIQDIKRIQKIPHVQYLYWRFGLDMWLVLFDIKIDVIWNSLIIVRSILLLLFMLEIIKDVTIEKEKKQIVLGLLCWYISLLLIGITGWIWYTIA